MTTRMIPVQEVVVGSRLRETSGPQVVALMESIREIGLLNPITVGEASDQAELGRREHGFPLVAGAHRLEACKRLGHTEIEANVVTLSELQRRLAECDENLASTVLSVAERAHFIGVRKAVYLALHPETAHGGDHGNQHTGGKSPTCGLASFTRDTAAKTGRSRSSIERDAKRAAAILPETLEAIRGTELDTGRNLDKLAKLDPETQRKVGDDLRRDNVTGARVRLTLTEPPPSPEGSNVRVFPGSMTTPIKLELKRLTDAWDKASRETQIRFLRRLEKRGIAVPKVG